MASKNELLRAQNWVKIEPFCRRYSVEYLGRDHYHNAPLYLTKIWSLYEDGSIRPNMAKKGIGHTVRQSIDNCFDRGVPFDGNVAHTWESYHKEEDGK